MEPDSASVVSHPDAKGCDVPPWQPKQRFVFCFGLYSSGSTWLFNLIVKLLEGRTEPSRVARFYADKIESFPRNTETADYLVVKSHMPERSMVALAGFTAAPCFITVRDPRDAVKSLMDRFFVTFEGAHDQVSRSSSALTAARSESRHALFRFEDRFFDSFETLEIVASSMGLGVTSDAESIFASLTRENVAKRIERLAEAGAFGPERSVMTFDPETHWHYRHAGEARVGAHRGAFSPEQDARMTLANRSFARAFGYDIAPLLGRAGTLDFGPDGSGRAHLVSGFSEAGGREVWTDGPQAVIRLNFADRPGESIRLSFDFTPFTAAEPPKALRCRVAVSGKDRQEIDCPAGPMKRRDHAVTVPVGDLPCSRPLSLDITLTFEELSSPKERGINEDPRKLGLWLHALTYGCA